MKKRIGVLTAVICTVIMILASCGSRFEDYRILTTLSNNTEWGTVTTTGLNGSGGASPNSKIVITAVPKTGYYADHCTCSEIPDLAIVKTDTENVWELTMPDRDITVTVYFKAIEGEPEAPKLIITDGNSSNGIKLKFENIPVDAKRRYVYLGTGADKTQIDCKAEWAEPEHVKDATYFYPFATKGNNYSFTVCYEDYEKLLDSATVTITAQGGVGDIECTNREKIALNVDKNGNLKWITKPVIIENINTEKQILYGIQGWDAVSDWVNPATAWLTKEEGYFWVGKWDCKAAGEKVEYNDFNIIDLLCIQSADDEAENIKNIDTLIKNKGINVYVSYYIKNTLAEDDWYSCSIFEDKFFFDGKDGKGVFVLEPSPLLGTWMGKSKAYTFYQNKVVVEDTATTKEYAYTYTDKTVTFNNLTYEYEINEGRTRLSITEDDDTVKKYSRTVFGKKLEAGYETAEIKVEDHKIKFVTKPGAKTVPAGETCYRVDFLAKSAEGNDVEWLNVAKVNSLTYEDIDIDPFIWNKTLRNKKLIIRVLWGQSDYWKLMCDELVVPNYEVADEWKRAEVKLENNVLKFVRAPGAKTIPADATGYRIDFCTEPAGGDDTYGWINVAYVKSLTYGDINIDDYLWDKTLRNNKLVLHVLWGLKNESEKMCNDLEVSDYKKPTTGYELPVTTIDGTVVSMTKPGAKILAAYPDTDHYTVFIHKEANKYENWLAVKDFALSENITFDLYELNINPSDIIDGKVNICLELKKSDGNMLKRLTDNNWVSFDGYKYHITLSDNTIGMTSGLSISIGNIPEEAKIRDIGIVIDGKVYQIHWTKEKHKETTFTYPFVNANTEYEVFVNFYIMDESDKQGKKIATNSIKTTPKGGTGSIIAVNAPDISGKIEGNNFVWTIKPSILGSNTNGFVQVRIFNSNWDFLGWINNDYQELLDDQYTGFSLDDVTWEDSCKGSNVNVLNLQYIYDANDATVKASGLPTDVIQNSQEFKGLSYSIPK